MKRRRGRYALGASILITTIFLAGCEKSIVYNNLTEREANEVVVTLYNAGIHASKEAVKLQNEVFWNVNVSKKDLQEARRILLEQNVPTKYEPGLCGIYKEKQIVPTPDEQKARFLCGIKGDIINALKSIPEVVDASVVINMPTPEEFGRGEEKRPTASVVVKVKPDQYTDSQVTESKMQQFVANSVEKLNPRDVSVVISYISQKGAPDKTGLILPGTTERPEAKGAHVETVRIAGISVSKESAGRLKVYLVLFFVILVVISAILVINVVRTTRTRQEMQALVGVPDNRLLEGEVEEQRYRLGSGEGGASDT